MNARVLIYLSVVIATVPLCAKVKPLPVEIIAKASEIIVVAKVKSVVTTPDGKKYASAAISEVWKGQKLKEVEFLASPTWECDESAANEGETVVLFLEKNEKSRSYAIVHSGHGRLPLRTVEAKLYATFNWFGLVLPDDTPVIDGPEPRHFFISSVELSVLRELVSKAIRK